MSIQSFSLDTSNRADRMLLKECRNAHDAEFAFCMRKKFDVIELNNPQEKSRVFQEFLANKVLHDGSCRVKVSASVDEFLKPVSIWTVR